MAKELRIGIFGVDRGRAFYEPIGDIEGAKIVAVCDRSEDMLRESTYPAIVKGILPSDCKVFNDFDEFIDFGFDAVIMTNFFHEHAKYAIKALDKGIAVMTDTTAAPTMKQCVDLCEAVERNNGKYMLGTNVPFMYGPMELKKQYDSGKYGKVKYGQGEYLHYDDPFNDAGNSPTPHHWRKYLPMTYYNMHSLGPLMYITGDVPVKVNARTAPNNNPQGASKHYVFDQTSACMYETDSGAVFNSTGCSELWPTDKWFRLNCEKGTIETFRGNQEKVKLTFVPWLMPEGEEAVKKYNAKPEHLNEVEARATHNGSDYRLAKAFIEYINGGEEPFFNVYRSVALSAAGILAFYSALDDGKTYYIPDFTNKEERAKWANDDRTPFPREDGTGATLPCTVHRIAFKD